MGLYECPLELPFLRWWSPSWVRFQPLAAIQPGDHGWREQPPSSFPSSSRSVVRRRPCLSSSVLGQLAAVPIAPWTSEEGGTSRGWWFVARIPPRPKELLTSRARCEVHLSREPLAWGQIA